MPSYETYIRRRAEGKCPKCGITPEPLRILCIKCAAHIYKNKEEWKKRMSEREQHVNNRIV